MLGIVVLAVCALLLVLGYVLYGRLAEYVYGFDRNGLMPCVAHPDGVDAVPMPLWRVFLIQLLNIAGLGPVVGALMGCLFGPVSLLWIVIGCIGAGATHDFMSAMMSADADGAGLPELVGNTLGNTARHFLRVACVFLLLLVGVVFTQLPAGMLEGIFPSIHAEMWCAIILVYYFLATILPINVIIGRLYPIFGALFLFMAVGLLVMLPFSGYEILPNLDFLTNVHPAGIAVWPALFVTIACGAISGFHATQSPMMVRCLKHRSDMRKVFYGAMIVEGLVALIWATVGLTLRQVVIPDASGAGTLFCALKPAQEVTAACKLLLGSKMALPAVLGVVVLAISSGDTAMRSCRLMMADSLKLGQLSVRSRLVLALPIFAAVLIIAHIDYSVVWRYFGWANQVLSCFTLWAITACLRQRGRAPWITLVPALFMTAMCTTFFFCAPECGIGLDQTVSTGIGIAVDVVCLAAFLRMKKQQERP